MTHLRNKVPRALAFKLFVFSVVSIEWLSNPNKQISYRLSYKVVNVVQ